MPQILPKIGQRGVLSRSERGLPRYMKLMSYAQGEIERVNGTPWGDVLVWTGS